MIKINKKDLKTPRYEDKDGNIIQGELATDGIYLANTVCKFCEDDVV